MRLPPPTVQERKLICPLCEFITVFPIYHFFNSLYNCQNIHKKTFKDPILFFQRWKGAPSTYTLSWGRWSEIFTSHQREHFYSSDILSNEYVTFDLIELLHSKRKPTQ